MKKEKTQRGFALAKFKDANGKDCSIQKSSAAENDYIWLGCDAIGLKHFKAGQGWKDITEPDTVNRIDEHYIANTRMHLDRDTVAKLLPLLKRFVRTGNI